MNTTHNTITTQPKNELFENDSNSIVEAQWNAIAELERKYNGVNIYGTNNIFSDSTWIEATADDDYKSPDVVSWDMFSDLQLPARLLICKYVTHKGLSLHANALSTQVLKATHYNRFFRYLNNKGILVGKANSPLLGLNHATNEDVEEFIDNYLATGISNKTAQHALSAINDLKNGTSDFMYSYPFLYMKTELPWELDKVSIKTWIERRMSDLGIIDNGVVPYRPFSATTAMMLVERSIDILDNYAEKAVELISDGDLFAKTKTNGCPNHRFTDKKRREHAVKYKGVFDSIVPMELDRGRGVKAGFYGKFFRIIQSALLNIILFTTGLRNSDVKLLRVGCCKPSEATDHLFYISTDLQKTKNDIAIPVPEQTHRAISYLEKMRFGENDFVLAGYNFPTRRNHPSLSSLDFTNYNKESYRELYKRNLGLRAINERLKEFANHFNIPFIDDDGNDDLEATAHRYRATTAGWLASASNLSVLLVRRLFGHTNTLMPLSYLHHNPNFIQALEEITEDAHNQVAEKLTQAVADERIGGAKGKELLNGFRYQKGKSQSVSEAQIMVSFHDQLKERLDDGQLCGFITPLAVICGRNPTDSRPTPCAKKSYSDTIAEAIINTELLNNLSIIRPDQCIGNKCEEAIIGEWSTALKDSFIWYAKLLKGVHGDQFTEDHYKDEAKAFIRQYAEDMKTVFGLEFDNVK